MKKSLISIALFAFMAAGVAQADSASIQPLSQFRFDLTCSFPSAGCSADSRILLDVRRDQVSSDAAKPEWFGNLLAVSCADGAA